MRPIDSWELSVCKECGRLVATTHLGDVVDSTADFRKGIYLADGTSPPVFSIHHCYPSHRGIYGVDQDGSLVISKGYMNQRVYVELSLESPCIVCGANRDQMCRDTALGDTYGIHRSRLEGSEHRVGNVVDAEHVTPVTPPVGSDLAMKLAIVRPCPKCGAESGYGCVSQAQLGGRRGVKWPHEERLTDEDFEFARDNRSALPYPRQSRI